MTNIILEQAINISDMLYGTNEDFELAVESLNNLKLNDLTVSLIFNLSHVCKPYSVTTRRRKNSLNLNPKYEFKSLSDLYQLVLKEPTELNKSIYEEIFKRVIHNAFNLTIDVNIRWNQ
jgi:hypothetical protein